jgi:hypothetical protein
MFVLQKDKQVISKALWPKLRSRRESKTEFLYGLHFEGRRHEIFK